MGPNKKSFGPRDPKSRNPALWLHESMVQIFGRKDFHCPYWSGSIRIEHGSIFADPILPNSWMDRGKFRHVQHVLPNRGPTKRGPPQARYCRTPARHFLTCGVGPIYTVLRHLKQVHAVQNCILLPVACGLGALYAVLRNLELCARSLEIELE